MKTNINNNPKTPEEGGDQANQNAETRGIGLEDQQLLQCGE